MTTLDINKPTVNYGKIWNSPLAFNTQTTPNHKY